MRDPKRPAVSVTPDKRAIIRALYEVVAGISPSFAATIDVSAPDVLRLRIIPFLEEWAPDGYPFGVDEDGDYGFWPLDGI